MYSLHLNFIDSLENKIYTPFLLINNYPILPRTGDTFEIDLVHDGINPFDLTQCDFTTEKQFEEFLSIFTNPYFKVATVNLLYFYKHPLNNDSYSYGITLKNEIIEKKHEELVRKVYSNHKGSGNIICGIKL